MAKEGEQVPDNDGHSGRGATPPMGVSAIQQSGEVFQSEWADLPEVAFLELADGRLQGVIPSETTPERVYASSISAGDHGLSCRSNDDLACGGLGERSSCRHIEALLAQAVKEFGAQRVARYLSIEPAEGQALGDGLHPTRSASHASEVFSSFLQHMAYLRVPVRKTPPS